MLRRWVVSMTSFLFLALQWIATAHSEFDPAALKAWVGNYPHDLVHGRTFLNTPDILAGIISALGTDAIPQIKSMATVGPILRRGDWIIAYGCQPHKCADAKWWVAINLISLETRACLASLGSPTVRLGASGRKYTDVLRVPGNACPEPEKAIPMFDTLLQGARASETDKPGASISPPQSVTPNSNWIRVPLKKDGGTFGVPVEINSTLTLDFIVDSGAADVSVPADVFLTLIRTGTIRDSDVTGEQTYVLADGSKSKSITFTIRSLKIGDTIVKNVKGSVATRDGMLLLGQSFLGRFKTWSVDNARHELVLEQQ
jgi:clan AA aspartic protease (TIGR02281 family)